MEVEIRSFISQEQYDRLLHDLRQKATTLGEEDQETWYFDCEQDLRIQKSTTYAKVWLKKGKLHDEVRSEIEVKTDLASFNDLAHLFEALGYHVKIKWFRHRNNFLLDGISIMLDYTKGYGYIVEFEKITNIENKDVVMEELKTCMKNMNISLTPKEEFDKKYAWYQQHWKELILENK